MIEVRLQQLPLSKLAWTTHAAGRLCLGLDPFEAGGVLVPALFSHGSFEQLPPHVWACCCSSEKCAAHTLIDVYTMHVNEVSPSRAFDCAVRFCCAPWQSSNRRVDCCPLGQNLRYFRFRQHGHCSLTMATQAYYMSVSAHWWCHQPAWCAAGESKRVWVDLG